MKRQQDPLFQAMQLMADVTQATGKPCGVKQDGPCMIRIFLGTEQSRPFAGTANATILDIVRHIVATGSLGRYAA